MNKLKNLLIVCLVLFGVRAMSQVPTTFSNEALKDTFITLEGETVTFKDILESHKGQNLVIDIWASWCGDCLRGLPKVKALQQDHEEVSYIFLSLDRSQEAWKNGIEKHEIKGDHYFMQSGWKGPFGTFVALDWIPRYMVVDKEGNIKLFKAIEADDKKIKDVL